MVWKPDLFLRNPFTKIRKLGIDEMVVHYLKSGHAVWQPGDMFESVCRVNVEKYPFDVQTCSLTFLPWGLNKNRLQFRLIKDVVDLDYFTSQGAWNVTETKAFTFERNTVQYVQFDITMERRSTFVMINMVYPVFLLGVPQFVCVLRACQFRRTNRIFLVNSPIHCCFSDPHIGQSTKIV
ncbi:hypothetical protein FSP39_011843 [Pinctada imbricata]|uniref:Neurotransmitter-gated ion-channel ligand-binding domain-containing protein n=1 Tax=Pinctada imbricata TaxID=66713 RepID=A0AA88YIC3_PINIB|nr:hypothetical protein FSP39_011843 [Pinctada imbricata]